MSVIPWQAEVATLINGTTIKAYRPSEQPAIGKFVALYGRAGSGKTFLVEQLARCEYTRPVLYLDLKGGSWVFADDADITIVPIQNYRQFATVTSNMFMQSALPFKSVVIDHGTELQALNLMDIQGLQGGKVSGSGYPTRAQFGFSTATMVNIVRGYKDHLCERMGIHVVLIIQEDARQDSVTNQIVKSGLAFTPALAKAVPAMVDIIGHVTVKDDKPNYTRVLNFATTAHNDAKFRRKDTEAAAKIPLTIAYRREPVFIDLFNTLVGGKEWPTARYDKLKASATVDYATVAAEQPSSSVETAIAQRGDAPNQAGE